MARLNPDGILDTAYGAGQAGAHGTVKAIAIQADDKMLAAGYFPMMNSIQYAGIARLNLDGTIDHSFGDDSGGFGASWVEDVAVSGEGQVLIGGRFTTVNRVSRSKVALMNPDGSLDHGFRGGVVNGNVFAVAFDRERRILIGGDFTAVNGVTRGRIARLNRDGTLDPTFAAGSFGNVGANGDVHAIAVQRDGKILIGGSFTTVLGSARHRIARLNSSGTVDSSFGGATGNASAPVHAIHIQSDDNILIAGEFSSIGGQSRSRVARLHGAFPPPHSVGLDQSRVLADRPAGTRVGLLSISDPDAEEIHALTLVSGEGDEGNEYFTIDGNLLTTTAEFDAAEQETYTVRIRATNSKGLWVKQSFILTVVPDPYLTWADALPGGEREPAADPGGHGIPNLLRYAFGMEPLQPDREKLPRIGEQTMTDGEQPGTYLTLTYTRRTDDDSLIYIAEASDDLLTWASFAGIEEIADDGNGETETVILIDSEPMKNRTKRFLRLRVER